MRSVLHLGFVALVLRWACAAGPYRELSAIAAGKFLQVEHVAKSDAAEIETIWMHSIAVITKGAKRARTHLTKGFDTSWQNNLVIIPCFIVGSLLFWRWYTLDPSGKIDDIFTARDADLREVEISKIGASGVTLLRRQSDRHTGIMFACTGIMLQTIFLYFIAVFLYDRISREAKRENTGEPTPVALLFCSLFCNTMTCCSSFILGLKCRATKSPDGYEKLHETLVLLDSFVIPSVCIVVGSLYLCASNGISSLVFNSTSMAFICSINMQIAGLMSWSLSGHGGRAFQPANISIKDSECSTSHAQYSFICSIVVALAVLPISWLVGIV